ncbi:hypothetical protein [Bradyrhizobium sp.]|uniref:hypothetical protein n=1 Tax=Bradyrhizobium sp. TaxID=376 RepID=UPI001DF0D61D|nr:hypothetical protein [Bradyrhizobium sp.]MBI5319335.1 hypothetical protein [Bradyrhizobium sp.]
MAEVPENRPAAGGKLDAQKIEEYSAEVQVDWDTSNWFRWTLTGRILPERSEVYFQPRTAKGISAAGRFQVEISADNSELLAYVVSDRSNLSLFELIDIVRTTASFPVNYIAFKNRGVYEIVLDRCTNDSTGEELDLPIFEPLFDSLDPGLCFTPADGMKPFSIPYEHANHQLVTAVQDLTHAIRQPRRTFEHCRMAVEVMRSYFDPTEIKKADARSIEGEKRLCEVLKVERNSLLRLDAVAARSRHGNLVVSMDWPLRKRALELVWEITARFAHYVEHKISPENWKLLDVEIETYNAKKI